MDVREIVIKHLKENGFDGLSNIDCGCKINDLAPCDCCIAECEPGYETKNEDTEADFEWIITSEKPNTQKEIE